MPEHSRLQKLFLALVFLAGLFPFVYFLWVQIGFAQEDPSAVSVTPVQEPNFDRYIENVAFGVGEKLFFDINYGFINAGSATMEVERLIEYQGRPCYQIVTHARSNSFFSNFYRVEDRIESIVDALGVFSWRFSKDLSEGNYKAENTYSFGQRENVVYYDGDTVDVGAYIQDALSTLYYVRTQPLQVGKSIYVDNFVDGKKYHLEVQVLKKETISVDAGTFDCIVVEPLSENVGVFKHEGRLKVWLTDDYIKMPVLMKSKVVVGSISAELTDFQLGEIFDY